MKAIIYRREDENTTPRGFGRPPTYHFDEPRSSDAEMIWVYPVEITLPVGYTLGKNSMGETLLYDEQDNHVPVIDFQGHPAIIGGRMAKTPKGPVMSHIRLDK